MQIHLFRIGNKYGPEYEKYLNEKLKDYNVVWHREAFDRRVALQWNKMLCMSLDIDEPVVVMDIDLILMNDYQELLEYPIEKGQFLGMDSWWGSPPSHKLNGGFFKYYPKDCKYIYEKFMEKISYWQQYYILKKLTIGPVNGEQFFVEDSVKENLELITFPSHWATRWTQGTKTNNGISKRYARYFDKSIQIKPNVFNKELKIIHFTHSLNKPHESNIFAHLYN